MSTETRRHPGCLYRVMALIVMAVIIFLIIWLRPLMGPGGAVYDFVHSNDPPTPTPMPTPTPEPILALIDTGGEIAWAVAWRCGGLFLFILAVWAVYSLIRRIVIDRPHIMSRTVTGEVIATLPSGEMVKSQNMIGESLVPHRDGIDLLFWIRRILVFIFSFGRRLLPMPDRIMPMSRTDKIDDLTRTHHSVQQAQSAAFAAGMSGPNLTEAEREMRMRAMRTSGRAPYDRGGAVPPAESAWTTVPRGRTSLPFTADQISVSLGEPNDDGIEAAQAKFLESRTPGWTRAADNAD